LTSDAKGTFLKIEDSKTKKIIYKIEYSKCKEEIRGNFRFFCFLVRKKVYLDIFLGFYRKIL